MKFNRSVFWLRKRLYDSQASIQRITNQLIVQYQTLKFNLVTSKPTLAKIVKLSIFINFVIFIVMIALCVILIYLNASKNSGNGSAMNFTKKSEMNFEDMELSVLTRKTIDEPMSAFEWSFRVSETNHRGLIVLHYHGVSDFKSDVF